MARAGTASPAPRRLVAESWARALARRLAPDRAQASEPVDREALTEARAASPLRTAMPVVRDLLGRDAEDGSGVVVAVGDPAGRLLWVEGDRTLLRRAEAMRFVAGADWSEVRVGTTAPGTALALDTGVQIAGREHFAFPVQRWSCTAVPVHDLRTHRVLGVVDITGGPEAAAPHVLPLVRATVAAVERELLLAASAPSPENGARTAPRLSVLGRDAAVLTDGATTLELSLRHAELLLLLAWHPAGLSAERLAELVHGRAEAVRTVRPEMTRLRRALQPLPGLAPLARPYRLPAPLGTDAHRVLRLLDRGAHRAALDACAGAVLPGSAAPGVEAIRADVAARLREAMLEHASAELLLEYADRLAPLDAAPLLTALRLLPARSPKRAGVVARLESGG